MSAQVMVTVLVIVFVVGWFAAGTHFNVRKGEQALRWLQQGLPLIGEKTTLRWLGSSIAELKIQNAKAPFRTAEVLIVLEPRDVAPLWVIARARGRRDLFVFRATTMKRPRVELEARDPKSWVLATAPSPSLPPAVPGLVEAATLDNTPPIRLAVRATEPNLEVQWRLDDICKHEARAVMESLGRVAACAAD